LVTLYKIKSAISGKPSKEEVKVAAEPVHSSPFTVSSSIPSIESDAFAKYLETDAFLKLLENEKELTAAIEG
jgi:hypothetical protein